MFPAALRAPLAAHLPSFVYQLQDLARTPDENLRGEALRQLVLLLFKHAREEDFWDRFPDWIESLRAVYHRPADGLRAIEALLRYIVMVGQNPPPPEVYHLLNTQLSPDVEDKLMGRWAEQLRQEGIKQEHQASLQRAQARLLKQLQLKFGAPSAEITAQVQQASEEDIDRWSERILTADSAEAILQG